MKTERIVVFSFEPEIVICFVLTICYIYDNQSLYIVYYE